MLSLALHKTTTEQKCILTFGKSDRESQKLYTLLGIGHKSHLETFFETPTTFHPQNTIPNSRNDHALLSTSGSQLYPPRH